MQLLKYFNEVFTSLYVIYTNLLSDMYLQAFSPTLWFVFLFSLQHLSKSRGFNFEGVQLSNFKGSAFYTRSLKSLPILGLRQFSVFIQNVCFILVYDPCQVDFCII